MYLRVAFRKSGILKQIIKVYREFLVVFRNDKIPTLKEEAHTQSKLKENTQLV